MKIKNMIYVVLVVLMLVLSGCGGDSGGGNNGPSTSVDLSIQIDAVDDLNGLLIIDYTIFNNGDDATDGSYAVIDFWMNTAAEPTDDSVQDYSTVSTAVIPAGGSVSETFMAPVIDHGEYAWAKVDVGDMFVETDETNNLSGSHYIAHDLLSGSFTLGAYPDRMAIEFTTPDHFSDLKMGVMNVTPGASIETRLYIYYDWAYKDHPCFNEVCIIDATGLTPSTTFTFGAQSMNATGATFDYIVSTH